MAQSLAKEHAVLQGRVVAKSTPTVFLDSIEFIGYAVLTFLLGVLSTLVLSSLHLLIRKGPSRISTCVLLVATIALYMSTCLHAAVRLAYPLVTSSGSTLVFTAHQPSLPDGTDSDRHYTMQILSNSTLVATTTLNGFLNDCIVWWRVVALWPDNLAVKTIGGGLISTMLVLGIIATYCTTPASAASIVTSIPFWNLIIACMAASWGTNFLATFLIGYKAWLHWRFIRETLGRKISRSRCLTVLIFLVESGIWYCAFVIMILAVNLVNLYLNDLNSSAFIVFANVNDMIAGTCLVPVVALYPALIIFITALNTSTIDSISLGGMSRLSSANHAPHETGTMNLRFAPVRPAGGSESSGSTLVIHNAGLEEQSMRSQHAHDERVV